MSIDIRFDLGCKLVRDKQTEYKHTFGGDTPYDGAVPEGCSDPVHLLFRLDLTDPTLPFTVHSDFRFLPLFVAFNYDASPMSYRVHNDSEIEILGLETTEFNPNCPYPGFPQRLDCVPVSVQRITYGEQRDLAMVWFIYSHPEIYDAIPTEEIQRLKDLGYPITRIGRIHDLLQLPRGEPCPNPDCDNHGEAFCLETLATIPERPFPDLDLWHSDGSTVQIVYEICKLCCSIRTYNTYD